MPDAGFEPRIRHEVAETSTLVTFVAAGLGVAVVPAPVSELVVAGATYRPLSSTARMELVAATRADDDSALLARTLRVLRQAIPRALWMQPVPGPDRGLPTLGPTDDRTVFTADDPDVRMYPLLTATVVPRPIAWISTRSAAGVGNLAPHSFFTVSCANPPIVQFTSVGDKDTLRNVQETGEFVVNVASAPMTGRSTIPALPSMPAWTRPGRSASASSPACWCRSRGSPTRPPRSSAASHSTVGSATRRSSWATCSP